MSYYPLPLNTPNHTRSMMTWVNGFTFTEVQKIIEDCESLPKNRGQVQSEVQGAELEAKRACSIAWVPSNEKFEWLYQRIAFQITRLNAEFFGFDLYGFSDLQYTVYEGAGKEFYDWHVDMHGKEDASTMPVQQRKLSYTLQLSDKQDYEGGELWLWGADKTNAPKERGLAVVFPSYTLHRVTPVTSGVRRSLVVWATGPDIR